MIGILRIQFNRDETNGHLLKKNNNNGKQIISITNCWRFYTELEMSLESKKSINRMLRACL